MTKATGKLVEINGGVRRGCPLPCTILGNDAENGKTFNVCGTVGRKKENLLK